MIENQNPPPNNPAPNQNPLPNTNVANTQPKTNSVQSNQPSNKGQGGGQVSPPVNAISGQESQPGNINKAENPEAKNTSGQSSIVDSSVNTQKSVEPANAMGNQNTNNATKLNGTKKENAPANPCESDDISLCFKLISEQMNKTEQLLNMANKTLAMNGDSEEPIVNEPAKPQTNVFKPEPKTNGIKPANDDALPTNATQQNQVIQAPVSAPKSTAPIVQNDNQQKPSGNDAALNNQNAPTNIQSPSAGQNLPAQKQPAPPSE